MVVARVKNPDATVEPLGATGPRAALVRVVRALKRDGEAHVATPDVRLHLGDLITVVGTPSELERIVAWIGDIAVDPIDRDRGELDMRRIVVSNREVAGHALGDLDFPGRFGAVMKRVRRGAWTSSPMTARSWSSGTASRPCAPRRHRRRDAVPGRLLPRAQRDRRAHVQRRLRARPRPGARANPAAGRSRPAARPGRRPAHRGARSRSPRKNRTDTLDAPLQRETSPCGNWG